jgi:hypothetical protein
LVNWSEYFIFLLLLLSSLSLLLSLLLLLLLISKKTQLVMTTKKKILADTNEGHFVDRHFVPSHFAETIILFADFQQSFCLQSISVHYVYTAFMSCSHFVYRYLFVTLSSVFVCTCSMMAYNHFANSHFLYRHFSQTFYMQSFCFQSFRM